MFNAVFDSNSRNKDKEIQNAIGYIDQQFKCLADELKKKKTAFPRTIVYCTSIANCGEIFSFFQEELGGVADGMYAIYHSRTPQGIFYMESFPLLGKQMALWELFSTNALGLGANLPDIRRVIHYGIPREHKRTLFWELRTLFFFIS